MKIILDRASPKTIRHVSFDHESRTINFVWADFGRRSEQAIRVHQRYGRVLSVRFCLDHIRVDASLGKAAYDYNGQIPWSKLRSELMERFVPEVRTRIKFEILLIRYRGGGSGRAGARARIYIDGQIVAQGRYADGDFTTRTLGKAVADYLELPAPEAISSEDNLIASMALLDRSLDTANVSQIEPRSDRLWLVFFELRKSLTSGG